MKKKKIAIYLLFFLVAFFIYFFCGGMDNKFNRLKERNTSADDQIIEESMEKAAISTTDDKRIEKTEKDCADDVMEKSINPYFFPEGVATVKYDGYFHFKDYDIEKQVMVREVTAEEAVELSICEEKVLGKGVLYSAEIKDNGEIYLGSGEWGEKNREYFVIGLFYVQEDKIYLIRDIEIENDITEEELIKKGTLVCQFESKTYPEGWEFPRRYWNEYINVIGDRCEFYSYITWAGRTSFVESFQWQKGIGLVKYYRGTSFDDDDIMIFLN